MDAAMYPDPIDERIAKAISESRRLIEETKRLLQESSEVFVPRYTDLELDSDQIDAIS